MGQRASLGGGRPLRAVALLAVSVPVGLVGWSLGGGASRHLEAESLVLRDSEGRVRAKLVADRSGVAKIALLDADGQDRVALRASARGEAAVELYEGGRLRLSLGSGPGGQTRVVLSDGKGGPAARLVVGPNDHTGLELSAPGRRLRLGTDGVRSAITVTDASGHVLGVIDPDASPGRTLATPPPLEVNTGPPARGGVPGQLPAAVLNGRAPLRREAASAQRRPQTAQPAAP